MKSIVPYLVPGVVLKGFLENVHYIFITEVKTDILNLIGLKSLEYDARKLKIMLRKFVLALLKSCTFWGYGSM